jgi:Flp pilus assembly protein TadD
VASPVRALLVLALLGIVGSGLYAAAFDAPFHFDDHHSIRQNPHLSDLSRLDLSGLAGYFSDATQFSGQSDRAMYRPLLLVSYTLTTALVSDLNWIAALHVSNVLLHIVVSWLIWALVGAVCADSRRASLSRTPAAVAILAGLGFLLHPLASETALYISARSESMGTLFMLLTLLLWRRARVWGALICFALALGCKSTMIVTPAILLGFDRLFPRSPPAPLADTSARPWASQFLPLLPFMLLAAAYLIWMQHLIQASLVDQHVRSGLEQLMVQLHSWVYQLKLLVVSHPLSVIHPVDTRPAGSGHLFGAFLCTSAIWVLASSRIGRRIGLGLIVAGMPLVIPSVIPLHTVVSEHRLYPVLALSVILLVCGVKHVRPLTVDKRFQYGWVGALLVIWSGQAAANVDIWKTEISLWHNARSVSPLSARAHEFLGDALRRGGQGEQALKVLQRADQLYGGRLEIQLNIASILLQQNELVKASDILYSLLTQYPKSPGVLYNLALASRQRAPAEAVELLNRALIARPDWPEAIMERSLIQEELGQRDVAASSLRVAVERHADWLDGWVNLGFIEARRGNLAAARSAWLQAQALSPGLTVVRQNLAELDLLESAGPPTQQP